VRINSNPKIDRLLSLRIVQFIHSQNCAAGIQLAHAGRKASTKAPFHQTPGDRSQPVYANKEEGGWPDDVVGPSSLPFAENYCTPNEMNVQQIEQFKEDFIKSVERSEKCGFDFLEIHAAHGYLLTEFLSPTSNKREDQYGEFLKQVFITFGSFEYV
jgi:2,4-dienoyl-CoA reductase-like NADH-dependent reductase (Old Yellow Enzyme family)